MRGRGGRRRGERREEEGGEEGGGEERGKERERRKDVTALSVASQFVNEEGGYLLPV